jgi:two-component sensor histidine kinase
MSKDGVVEQSPAADSEFELTKRVLELRVRQQEILAELGVLALRGTPFPELSQHTTLLVAEGIGAEFCKVMEYLPAEHRFTVRAGVGWTDGVVGTATVGADLESPAGFALRSGKPVISNHLGEEERFRTPQLLLEHGVHRAANVILQGDRSPYGVLEVDSRSKEKFTEEDLAFLQGAANILGMAIERQRFQRDLESALARQKILLREVDHRVKNSLQLVIGLLRLQATTSDNAEICRQLQEAAGRVSAVARVHQRLYRSSDIQVVDLGSYLADLCRDMDEVTARCEVHVTSAAAVIVPTDSAVPIGVLVNELVTNAVKHAYRKETGRRIWVMLNKDERNRIVISVRDEGSGLPAGFQLTTSKGLGMRIVDALARQLDAGIEARALDPGSEFVVSLPAPSSR